MKFKARYSLSLFQVEKRIDPEKGIIYGITLMQAGPAKGHGAICDETTLEQLKTQTKAFKSGLPIKFNIESFDHNDGKGMNCGVGKNPRIVDGKTVIDFHAMKTFPAREYLFEMAQDQPHNIGLSIEFKGTPEDDNGIKLARLAPEGLTAACFVDLPATCPNGLFSAVVDNEDPDDEQPTDPTDDEINMNPAEMTKLVTGCLAEAMKPFATQMQALETKMQALSEKKPALEGMSEDDMMAAGIAKDDAPADKEMKAAAYKALASAPLTVGSAQKMFFNIIKQAGGSGVIAKSNPAGGKEKENEEKKDPVELYKKAVNDYIEAGMKVNDAVIAVTEKQKDVYENFMKAKSERVAAKTYVPVTFMKASRK